MLTSRWIIFQGSLTCKCYLSFNFNVNTATNFVRLVQPITVWFFSNYESYSEEKWITKKVLAFYNHCRPLPAQWVVKRKRNLWDGTVNILYFPCVWTSGKWGLIIFLLLFFVQVTGEWKLKYFFSTPQIDTECYFFCKILL